MRQTIEEFEKTLSSVPLTPCNLKKGDTVLFINDYGVPFICNILGFAQLEDYLYGRFIHFDKDAFWFPVKLEQVTRISDVQNMIISKELLKLYRLAKNLAWHESSLIELHAKLEQFRLKMQFIPKFSKQQIEAITGKIYRILADNV